MRVPGYTSNMAGLETVSMPTGDESMYFDCTTQSTTGSTTGSITENTIASHTCSCGGNSPSSPLARTHYRVYRVTYMSTDLSHHAICVEINPEKPSSDWGRLFQVNGNLYEGMYHEFKTCKHPFHSLTGHTMQHIGWVWRQGSRLEEVCGRIPAPPKQWDDKLKRINPDKPVRHCQHWVVDAVTALSDSSVLQLRTADDDGSVMVRRGHYGLTGADRDGGKIFSFLSNSGEEAR